MKIGIPKKSLYISLYKREKGKLPSFVRPNVPHIPTGRIEGEFIAMDDTYSRCLPPHLNYIYFIKYYSLSQYILLYTSVR